MMNHQTACSMTTNKLKTLVLPNTGWWFYYKRQWIVPSCFSFCGPELECLPETKQSELVSPFILCIKSLPYKFALTLCPLSQCCEGEIS